MKKDKSAAVVTIKGAARMTPRGRREVAVWLGHQADMLIKYGKDYSPRFTGRYLYR